MPCHDTKDNAGLYRFISASKTITTIVVSFLFYKSYFTGITILVMFWPRRHSSKKSDFSKYKTIVLRRRPYFTPVRGKVTICFERLTNEPS